MCFELNREVEILIVEDHLSFALNLQEILEFQGYEVVAIADSAKAAITKASDLSPNLILMDICLADKMDGIQAAILIWNLLQIPIIFVTGYSRINSLKKEKLIYSFPYLLKPFTQQELHFAIETTINTVGSL